jgi:hypothetical protein
MDFDRHIIDAVCKVLEAGYTNVMDNVIQPNTVLHSLKEQNKHISEWIEKNKQTVDAIYNRRKQDDEERENIIRENKEMKKELELFKILQEQKRVMEKDISKTRYASETSQESLLKLKEENRKLKEELEQLKYN